MSLRLSLVCAAMYRPVGQGRALQRPLVPGRSATFPVLKSNTCSEQVAGIGKVGPSSPKTSSLSEVQLGAPCQPRTGTGSTGSRPSGDTVRMRVNTFSPHLWLINATRRPSGDHCGKNPHMVPDVRRCALLPSTSAASSVCSGKERYATCLPSGENASCPPDSQPHCGSSANCCVYGSRRTSSPRRGRRRPRRPFSRRDRV